MHSEAFSYLLSMHEMPVKKKIRLMIFIRYYSSLLVVDGRAGRAKSDDFIMVISAFF